MDTIFSYLVTHVVKGAGDVLVTVSGLSLNLFGNSMIIDILDLFNYFGWILLTIGVCFAIANVYVNYLEGNGISVHILIINILKSIIAMAFLKIGAIRVFELSVTLQGLITDVVSKNDDYDEILRLVGTALFPGVNYIWNLVIVIVLLVSFFMILFQALKRSGIYLIHIIIGYLYIFGIPNGNTEGFIDWCKQTVALSITNTLQVGMLFIGMNLMSHASIDPNDAMNAVLGLGVVLSATSVEKIAGRFGMSSDSRQSLGAGVRTASTISSVVRAATIKK